MTESSTGGFHRAGLRTGRTSTLAADLLHASGYRSAEPDDNALSARPRSRSRLLMSKQNRECPDQNQIDFGHFPPDDAVSPNVRNGEAVAGEIM